ncbi:MAG: hypothetical protein H8E34_04055 [Bacteroidetes bacterium]|nr:hypothetical protein [Bacteroidota bacterium]MBL6943208.1 hypothetical protein [Bacteroidales bacterium]
MSSTESRFIRWFASIAASLIVVSIIGLVTMYRATGIIVSKVQINEQRIIELKEFHYKDVELLRESVREIKSDQKIIISDVKEILREVK